MDIPQEQIQSAFADLLGSRLVRLGEGEAEVELEVRDQLRNRGGKLHGGALFSLVDIAMGLACSASHGFDRQSVTLECKLNFIRAVGEGSIRCVARVLHAGRRTLVVDANVFQNDKLVATGQGTFAQL